MLKTTIMILLVLVSTATSGIMDQFENKNRGPYKLPTFGLDEENEIGGPVNNPPPVAPEKKEKEPGSECPDGLKNDDGSCIDGTSTPTTTSGAAGANILVTVGILQLVITFYFY